MLPPARALRATLVTLALPLIALSCARPEPPQLTAKAATVTGITLLGIDIDLKMDAYNPNSFDLSARNVVARTVVDGKYDLGSLNLSSGVTLPAGQTTSIDVPAQIKWGDATQLAALGLANRTVPFRIDGTAAIGSAKLNVDVPFHFDGSITPDQLRAVAARSFPAIPGLPLLAP